MRIKNEINKLVYRAFCKYMMKAKVPFTVTVTLDEGTKANGGSYDFNEAIEILTIFIKRIAEDNK